MSLGFTRETYTVVEGDNATVCVRITSLPNSTLPEGINMTLSTADGSAGFYTTHRLCQTLWLCNFISMGYFTLGYTYLITYRTCPTISQR